jgi:sec-independent protein translocase protein TatB
MNFLGIGPLELILVFIIILLILGPNEMVKTGKTIGKIIRKISRSDEWKGLNRITREIRTLPNRLAREAELEELKEDLDKQISPIATGLKDPITVEFNAKPKPAKNINKPHENEDTSTSSDQEKK